MNPAPPSPQNGSKWPQIVAGGLLIAAAVYGAYAVTMPALGSIHAFLATKGHSLANKHWMTVFGMEAAEAAGVLVALFFGVWLMVKAFSNGNKETTSMAVVPAVAGAPAAAEMAPVAATPAVKLSGRVKHWNLCNILHIAPDAKRLWQFEARGKNIVLGREMRVPHAQPLPTGWVSKSWTALWQPKLNIAWLPAESVFLRVAELPAANAEETYSMVELQLEKLSPIPVTQIVWTMHVMGTHQSPPKPDGTVESLQMVIVIIAARAGVEEFLGRLERDGFLSDRLEAPMLDQLEAVEPKRDSVWFFPLTIGGQNAALAGWWFGGAWRNLSFVTLPPAGDRAAELKSQIGLLAMAGEVEGWLTGQPEWNLVADPVNATEWEHLLREAVSEPVRVTPPPPAAELAGRSALRVAASPAAIQLQPEEFTTRYREQFRDRLWLHGLGYVGLMYAVGLVIYFSAAAWEGHQARAVEAQVAALGNSYTNAIQLDAKLGILEKRERLKYAALDCWELTAENLPAAVTLARTGFADGSKYTLSGQVGQGDVKQLIDFYQALRNAPDKQTGKPFFKATSENTLTYHSQGASTMSWSFTLELAQSEGNL